MTYQKTSELFEAMQNSLRGEFFNFRNFGEEKSFEASLSLSRTENGEKYFSIQLNYEDAAHERHEARLVTSETEEGELVYEGLEPVDNSFNRTKQFELVKNKLEEEL